MPRLFNNIEVLHISQSLLKLLYIDTERKHYRYIGEYLKDHLKDQDSDITDSIIDNFINFDNMRVDKFPWALKCHRIWRHYVNPRQSERLFLTDVLLLDEFEDFFKPEHLSRLKKARVDLYLKVEFTKNIYYKKKFNMVTLSQVIRQLRKIKRKNSTKLFALKNNPF